MKKAVEVLGFGVPYLDGAEDELLEIMRNSTDRSTGSDELASHIKDWPTEYHLSRARVNLLKPFNLPKGTRVLDVGCVTGALTRQFAEWENEVIGLEGSFARCQVAAERVREFGNVQIVCGNLDEYVRKNPNAKFDFIMLCGVLEYSSSEIGGKSGPVNMLKNLRTLLDKDGTLAIAIENKLGFKYFVGYNEDHLGKPLINLQNYYPDDSGIRTWSKSELQNLLNLNGFLGTKWFAPYPDYKTPTAIVCEDLWKYSDGKQIVKNFIRTPIKDKSSKPAFDIDPLTYWQNCLDLEAPIEVANSFLVACTIDAIETNKFIDDGLLWMGNESRRKKFDNSKKIIRNLHGFELEKTSQSETTKLGELTYDSKTSAIILGDNLEDWLVENLRHTKLEDVSGVLQTWWSLARQILDASHTRVNFDVLPRNFVSNLENNWVFIDNEFYWNDSVSYEAIFLRSLHALLKERFVPAELLFTRSNINIFEFCKLVGKGLNLSITEKNLIEGAEFTSRIANLAVNADSKEIYGDFLEFFNSSFTKLHDNKFRLLTRFEREQLISDMRVSDEKILYLENHISELNNQKAEMLKSFSWKITKPLRFLLNPKKYIKSK